MLETFNCHCKKILTFSFLSLEPSKNKIEIPLINFQIVLTFCFHPPFMYIFFDVYEHLGVLMGFLFLKSIKTVFKTDLHDLFIGYHQLPLFILHCMCLLALLLGAGDELMS